MSPPQLRDDLSRRGFPAYRAEQLLNWVFEKKERDFTRMTNLPQALREELSAHFVVGRGTVAQAVWSSDGKTGKLLLVLEDGARIEAVSMRESGRHAACISSQWGCAMGCTFCATGDMGFRRNLSSAEILLQVLEIERCFAPVDRIVYMGMGEPLLNSDNVFESVEALTDTERFGIGSRRITISTCGIIPGMEAMASGGIPVRLAVSLNSPFQPQREELMPIARRFPLDHLLDVCETYSKRTGRRVMLEYVLFHEVNSSRGAALELARIAKRLRAKVNLIQYNAVQDAPFRSPGTCETNRFRDWLSEAGIAVTIRYRRGREILAGCGQLAGRESQVIGGDSEQDGMGPC